MNESANNCNKQTTQPTTAATKQKTKQNKEKVIHSCRFIRDVKKITAKREGGKNV
jgi:hypothetical protein